MRITMTVNRRRAVRVVMAGLAAVVLHLVSPAGAGIKDEGASIPEKAPCQVCVMQGEGHGVEKVAAVSNHEGHTYYFCSEGCKERFDEDPVGYLPMEFPMPAPEFMVHAASGEAVGLADFRGRWLLLDFWATWCKPCVKLMPEMDDLAGRYEERGLSVLGVSIDTEADKAFKFAEKREVAYPVAVDDVDNPAWGAYRVKVVPTVFLIDPDGQVVARWTGKWNHREVAETLESVLPS